MPVYTYERTRTSKKTKKRITETYYYYQGKYIDPLTRERKQYKKRGFKRESDAKSAERDFLQSLEQYNVMGNTTFHELYTLYYNDRKGKIKRSSLSAVVIRYKHHIEPQWRTTAIEDISLADLIKWQQDLLNATYVRNIKGIPTTSRYTNNYLKGVQETFRAILNHGIKLGYPISPTFVMGDYAKNKNEKKKEMLFWQPEEYFKFIDVVDETQYHALFNLLYWCGLRIGEALALQWKDIDFTARTVTIDKTYDRKHNVVTPPKTNNSYRTIIMPLKCYESLKKWHTEANYYVDDKQQLLVFGLDSPLPEKAIQRKKLKWFADAEVKVIRTHDFRHSHVSLLINQGFSAFDISKRLGHTVDMVNNTYGHWFNDSQQRMVDKLDKL